MKSSGASEASETRKNGGHTVWEIGILLVLGFFLFSFIGPIFFSRAVVPGAQQTKQINNAAQISRACLLFASDNAGHLPNGNFDPVSGKFQPGSAKDSAEDCFQDLFHAKVIEVEKIFWSPQHTSQCSPGTPNELSPLAPEENCWDYMAGLISQSPAHLPLIIEASDGGGGTTWTSLSNRGNHPWETAVMVAFVDGSIEKCNLNDKGEARIVRGENETHLFLPTPGINGWPEGAKIAPATPAP